MRSQQGNTAGGYKSMNMGLIKTIHEIHAGDTRKEAGG